ncbi:hypothetical protein PG993_015298 [Apiospora rasikravindrae]|uniref:Uncharacterized protein n=1 Tax=Apiospora rasikravindrae TaxID=990691 RepID=A0ABR1RQ78_9PEZI
MALSSLRQQRDMLIAFETLPYINMDVMASLHRHTMIPRVERQLRRVESDLSRISGLSSLSGSIRSNLSSLSSSDSVRTKASWSSQASRQPTIIEPDQDNLYTLAPSSHGHSTACKITPYEEFVAVPGTFEEEKKDDETQCQEDNGDTMQSDKGDDTASNTTNHHHCMLDLDVDGAPTTYSEDKGSAFTEDYVMQVEQELHEARENVRKAKKNLQHFSALHDRAVRSKDFGKLPSRSPDHYLPEAYYDREVVVEEDSTVERLPLVRATPRHWGLIAEVEYKLEKWQRDVDEWEETVVKLNAEILSFQIDADVVLEEVEDLDCGCRQDKGGTSTCDGKYWAYSLGLRKEFVFLTYSLPLGTHHGNSLFINPAQAAPSTASSPTPNLFHDKLPHLQQQQQEPAWLAQSVERETLNLKAAGSTPASGSIPDASYSVGYVFFLTFLPFLSMLFPL